MEHAPLCCVRKQLHLEPLVNLDLYATGIKTSPLLPGTRDIPNEKGQIPFYLIQKIK